MRSRLPQILGALVLVLVVVVVLPSQSVAEQRSGAGSSGVPVVSVTTVPSTGPAPRVVGTLTYDSNVPFNRDATDGGTVGNLFTTGVLDPHNVDAVSFRIAGNYGNGGTGEMVLTVWDQNPASFVVLRRQLLTGLPYIPFGGGGNVTAGTQVVNLATAIAGHTGAFLAGLRNTDYDPCAGNAGLNTTCDGVALTAGGVDPGLGFHGHRVPFTSGAFVPTITTVAGSGVSLGTVNAIFRVTGDNLPVELMRFAAE